MQKKTIIVVSVFLAISFTVGVFWLGRMSGKVKPEQPEPDKNNEIKEIKVKLDGRAWETAAVKNLMNIFLVISWSQTKTESFFTLTKIIPKLNN